MKASVGPLTTAPGHVGADRHHRRRRGRDRLAQARHRRGSGRSRSRGSRGRSRSRRRRSIAASASGVGAASAIPSTSTASIVGLAAIGDQELLQPAPAGRPCGRACARAARTSAAPAPRTPSARAIWAWASVRLPPSAMKLVPVEAGREVAVGEPEPVGGAELHEPLEDGRAVALDPPALLLVDLVGEPVGDQVGVGRDVDAEQLDVVGRVRDHRQPVAQQRPACPPRASRRRCRRRARRSDRSVTLVQWSPVGQVR